MYLNLCVGRVGSGDNKENLTCAPNDGFSSGPLGVKHACMSFPKNGVLLARGSLRLYYRRWPHKLGSTWKSHMCTCQIYGQSTGTGYKLIPSLGICGVCSQDKAFRETACPKYISTDGSTISSSLCLLPRAGKSCTTNWFCEHVQS